MSDDVRPSRFEQPIEDIEIVSRAPQPRTLITPEQLKAAQVRIELGVSIEEVAEDLACEKVMEEFNLVEGLVE